MLLGVMVLVGIGGYAFLRTPATASGPIQAVPLQLQNVQLQNATVQSESTSAVSAAPTVFEIDADQSEARFVIDEVLNGSPKTVIGATDQVAGQLAVSPMQPSDAQVGTILINARTLATDDSQRNRALANFILGTNDYEYISFTPTAIVGLPTSAVLGQPYDVDITGQLTIKDVAREATFDATVTPVSATELSGSATTTIRYGDWNISIPSVPFVAGVSDQARLELDFVATATA
jgi:polyisoprenoid-binding protein YceI